MDPMLKSGLRNLSALLQQRTGFLGLGPTYGEIILNALVRYASERNQEKFVVREAENILTEINNRNRGL